MLRPTVRKICRRAGRRFSIGSLPASFSTKFSTEFSTGTEAVLNGLISPFPLDARSSLVIPIVVPHCTGALMRAEQCLKLGPV